MRSSFRHRLSRYCSFDDHRLLAVIIGHSACRVSGKVLSLARLAPRRKIKRIIHPHSPDRHDMRMPLPASIVANQNVWQAFIFPDPAPWKQSLAALAPTMP